ncbi:Protein of unknown function [Gryllus bimaculatus]|nr:Protein of unknown function [Gryllus bimaculatus]
MYLHKFVFNYFIFLSICYIVNTFSALKIIIIITSYSGKVFSVTSGSKLCFDISILLQKIYLHITWLKC